MFVFFEDLKGSHTMNLHVVIFVDILHDWLVVLDHFKIFLPTQAETSIFEPPLNCYKLSCFQHSQKLPSQAMNFESSGILKAAL